MREAGRSAQVSAEDLRTCGFDCCVNVRGQPCLNALRLSPDPSPRPRPNPKEDPKNSFVLNCTRAGTEPINAFMALRCTGGRFNAIAA